LKPAVPCPHHAALQANRQLRELREIAKGVTKQLPGVIQNATAKIDEYARGMISGTGSTLFEELGFYYIGPVDGHNLQDLIDVLTGEIAARAFSSELPLGLVHGGVATAAPHCCACMLQTASGHWCSSHALSHLACAEIKTTETVGPVLLHIVTEKGRGYLPAESASDKMHGVVPYDTVTGKQAAPKTQVGGAMQVLQQAALAAVAASFVGWSSFAQPTAPDSPALPTVSILHQLLC